MLFSFSPLTSPNPFKIRGLAHVVVDQNTSTNVHLVWNKKIVEDRFSNDPLEALLLQSHCARCRATATVIPPQWYNIAIAGSAIKQNIYIF